MKILVTGGSGFIGSHVVDVLAARGHSPFIFDRVESPHHEPGSVATALGEVTDSDALAVAMDGCDAVIHLAAMADVGDVKVDPEGAELVNSRGTLAVLEAARSAKVGRVVYGSTIWVYSDCEQTAVDENTPLLPPAHLYTATKLAGELYCRSYAELYGIEYTVLRFGIPYGPRARPAAVVPAFVNKALAGEPLTVAGSGSQGRRFVYVEDLADGIVRGLEPVASNRVYNLAGTETTTILEIAQTVQQLVGDTQIVHTPARDGDFGGKEVSSERALEELGWAPSTPFAEGVRRYVAWRRETDPIPEAEPLPAAPVPAAPDPDDAHAVRTLPSTRGAIARMVGSVRARHLRPALSAVALVGAFAWSFSTDESFAVLSKVFGGKAQTSVKTSHRDVGLLVRASPAAAPVVAATLERSGVRASFALEGSTGSSTLTAIRASGSDAVPQLRSGEFVRWLGTRSELSRSIRHFGLTKPVYYAPPRNGFTFGQDLLGHTAGATPVAGAVHFAGASEHGRLHPGAIVEVTLDGNRRSWQPVVDRLLAELRANRLLGMPADLLLRASRTHKA